ncbi:MAG: hypothetical protein IJ518_00095 [Clostridia bacterium]|nr:hypothetical protein [Clostridia bacterium]
MIILRDWMASIPAEDKCIAYVGENESVEKQFLIADKTCGLYAEWTFHLDMAFDLSSITTRESWERQTVTQTQKENTTEISSDLTLTETKETRRVTEETVEEGSTTDIAYLAKKVTKEGILLTWTVRRQHTQLPGRLCATLRAVGPNGEVKKSAVMVFEVLPAVVAEAAAVVPVSEFEEMEMRVGELVSIAEQISAHIDLTTAMAEENMADAQAYIESVVPVINTKCNVAEEAATLADAARNKAEEHCDDAREALGETLSAYVMANDCAQQANASSKIAGNYRAAALTAQQAAETARDEANAAAEVVQQTAGELAAAIIRGDVSGTAVRLEDIAEGSEALLTVTGVADTTAVTVKRYGKNLTPTVFSRKIVTGDGTNNYIDTSSPKASVVSLNEQPVGQQYAVSVSFTVNGSLTQVENGRYLYFYVAYTDGSTEYIDIVGTGNCPASGRCSFATAVGKTVKSIDVRKQKRWTAGTVTLDDLQVELGAVATAYEPYVEPISYIPDENGAVKVEAFTDSVATFLPDTALVTLTCTYAKNSTAVIAGLMKRIAALEAALFAVATLEEPMPDEE